MRMKRKTMVLAGLHWFILVLCHIVMCSHSLRHHRGHSSSLASSTTSSGSFGSDEGDFVNDQGIVEKPLNSMTSSISNLGGSSESQRDGGQADESELVSDAPLIPQVKVKPGHELKLKCDLNNTYGRIMWLLNGKPIRTDNGRYAIQGPALNRAIEGRLTINNVLPEDNGIWQCHETKFDGKEHVSKPIWVVVLAPPRAVHLEFEDGRRLSPSSSSPISRVTYREKDNVSIHCVVEGGNPPPQIIWFMDSKNMTNFSRIANDYLEDDKLYLTRSTFQLGNISRTDHNKTVLCIVHHELLPTTNHDVASYLHTAATLNIEYPPSFIISRIPGFGYPIREGIAMALKCDIDANPWSKPIWLKDGAETPVVSTEDGYLNFTQVYRNHTGWYKCISNHPLGKYSSVGYYLNVRYEPTIINQPPNLVEANLGDNLGLKCEADGRPSPALCWSRIGYGGSLTSVGAGQELILENILYQEAGSYRCVAQNRVGLEERRAQTHDVQVVVTGRPVVYPINRTVTGFAGKPLSLSVEICANPMPDKSFWIFGSTALRPGAKHRNKYMAKKLTLSDTDSNDCYLAVLTILNVSMEDAGEYMFVVRNSKGIHEGTILLNITQASFSSSVFTSSTTGSESSRAYSHLFSPGVTIASQLVVIFVLFSSQLDDYLTFSFHPIYSLTSSLFLLFSLLAGLGSIINFTIQYLVFKYFDTFRLLALRLPSFFGLQELIHSLCRIKSFFFIKSSLICTNASFDCKPTDVTIFS